MKHLNVELSLIFLLGLIIFTFGLGNHEFVQFESRFGVFAQEMLRNGISFFPTTYNQPYPDYLATQTILTYLFSLPTHKITIFTAVLPTAIASSLTLVFIYLIGRLHARLLGLYGVLFALFSFYFLAAARTITLDQFTCAATAACFYCAYSADLLNKKNRLWLIPFCWMLSFAIRGPIGLVIPASIIGCYYLIQKDIKMLIIMIGSAISLLLLGLAGLIGAAWQQGGHAFASQVIHMQITGRVAAANPVPFYYYFTATFTQYALTFPIAIAVFISYIKNYSRKTTEQDFILLKLLASWILIILIGMSIPTDEKMRYILPITPAVSLAAAFLYYRTSDHRLLVFLKAVVHRICLLLPFAGLLLVGIFFAISHAKHIDLTISYFKLSLLLSLLCAGTIICRKKLTHLEYYPLSIFIIGVLSFIVIYALIAQPLNVKFNQAKPFVQQVEVLRQASQKLVFYRIGPDGEDIKYKVAADKPLQPIFMQNPAAILQFSNPAIFIAKVNDFNQLTSQEKNPLKIFFTGKLGAQDCIVFAKSVE